MTNTSQNKNVVDLNLDYLDANAHGQSALLLVESLIHVLIEKKVISVSDAVEVVETAREVKLDSGPQQGESFRTQQKSLWLLEAISVSLQRDLPKI